MKKTPLIFLLSCFLFLFVHGVSAQYINNLFKEKLTEEFRYGRIYVAQDYVHDYIQSLTDDPISIRRSRGDVYQPNSLAITDTLIYKYDVNGNMTYREMLNYRDGVWKPFSRVTYTYFNDSRPIMWESEIYKNGLYQNQLRWLYEYDSQQNLISEQLLDFNAETNEWENRAIYSYEYDENGNEVRYLRQVWYSGEFVDDMEIISTYDDRDNKIELISIDKNWKLRILFEYDDRDNLIKRESQQWENGAWIPFNRIFLEYIYLWNKPSEILFETKNDSLGWIPQQKFEIDYHRTGVPDKVFLSSWSQNQRKLVPYEKSTISFDEENQNATVVEWNYDHQNNYYSESIILNYDFLDDGNLGFFTLELFSYRTVYFDEYFYDTDGPNTSIRELESISLSIFPNPASDYALIEWGEIEAVGIELYDSNGRQVMRDYPAPGSKEYNLRLEGYSAGMYTVLLRDKQGKVATERVLITND